MKMLPGFQRNRHKKGLFAASGLLLLLATQTIAQSGRRAPQPNPVPAPTPPQTDEITPQNGPRALKRRASLLVAREPSSKHLLSEDAIFKDFLSRLGEFKNVTATSIGDTKRDKAVKRAKSETESSVGLMPFVVDEFQSGPLLLNAPARAGEVGGVGPKTGQKKFEGKVYYKAVGGPMLKRDNWPNGTPIRMTKEAVAIEAAEQVRDWLLVQDIKKN